MLSLNHLLILSITVCSLLGLHYKRWYYSNLLYPYGISNLKSCYTILTNGFIHAHYLHLLINIALLYIFGEELERLFILKAIHLIWLPIIFFAAGILASLADTLINRNKEGFVSCGASHGVMGVIAAYIVLDHQPIAQMFEKLGLNNTIIVIVLVLFTLFKSIKKAGNINYSGHLVGLITGAAIALILK